MWPRLLAQLVELLPHASRLLPMADNFLSTRREAERAQAAALAAMSGNVREEVTRIADTFGGLSQQLADQKKQIRDLQLALEAAETHRITQTKQLEWLTSDVASLRVWIKFGITAIVLLLGVLLALTIQVFLAR